MCAKYTNTAVVTRFYQSSDPSQPAVFHGNMDVDSTANVLPRAPADVNGLLSCCDNITSRDQPSVNHPYLFIFDRV